MGTNFLLVSIHSLSTFLATKNISYELSVYSKTENLIFISFLELASSASATKSECICFTVFVLGRFKIICPALLYCAALVVYASNNMNNIAIS